MIKHEFEKIWSHKIVLAGMLIIIAATLLVNLDMGRQIVTPDGRTLYGKEYDTYVEEVYQKYAGSLDDSKKEAIIKNEKPSEKVEYGEYRGHPLYYAMVELFYNKYSPFYGKTVDEAFTKRGITIEVGNFRRWYWLFEYFPALYALLCVVIVMGLSGVFSEEYSRKMDALILTSRHGKRKDIQAKIAASFLFVLTCFAGWLIALLGPFLIRGGLLGGEAGIQLECSHSFWQVPYTMSCQEGAFLLITRALLGVLMAAGITLTISVLCKTSFLSVILSESIFFLPTLLGSLLPEKWIISTPMGCGLLGGLWQQKLVICGIHLNACWKTALIAVLVCAVSCAAVRYVFARHEVH